MRIESTNIETPEGYQPLNELSLASYLADSDDIGARLGGVPRDWRVEEVGDGNLNLVFLVHGPEGGVAVKQALPYVRLVGESWPLPLSRAHFEHLALVEQDHHAPGLVPKVHHYDPVLALIIMERLSPHIVMRRGMVDAVRYPRFVEDISTFMARTLFFTSDLALRAEHKKQKIAEFCANTALCKISEDLIFTEPYTVADNNRWTSPYLDVDAAAIRNDRALKIGVSELKLRFLTSPQALIHGGLHTGSIMVTEEDTRIIDPEFAFYGPMGFDIGAVIGNLLLNYFSQDGHRSAADPRQTYQDWVLEQVAAVWTVFAEKFRRLWDGHHDGDAYPAPLFEDAAEGRIEAQDRYLKRLLADTLGFAGAKMIRRIVGRAHNIDLEWIADPERRAICERRGLRLGRELIVNRASIDGIEEVTRAARRIRASV